MKLAYVVFQHYDLSIRIFSLARRLAFFKFRAIGPKEIRRTRKKSSKVGSTYKSSE